MALTLAITGKDTPQPPLGVPGAKPPAAGPSKAPAAPVVPRQTWMTAYAEVWERATNGSPMPFHVAVKAFKALEKTFGRDRLIEAWTTYCRTTDKVYLSVTSFSSKAGVYMRVPNATASTGRAREYVTAEDAKRFISSR